MEGKEAESCCPVPSSLAIDPGGCPTVHHDRQLGSDSHNWIYMNLISCSPFFRRKASPFPPHAALFHPVWKSSFLARVRPLY